MIEAKSISKFFSVLNEKGKPVQVEKLLKSFDLLNGELK